MEINVCDMIMGAGKSVSGINRMNEDTKHNYIFLTPYLKEVERVKQCCPSRKFVSPVNAGNGKLESLHSLLGKGVNVASTHALFKHYNEYTIELIKNGGYKLILDEVANVVEQFNITSYDLKVLLESQLIEIRDNKVHWLADDYSGRFDDIKYAAQTCNMFYHDDSLMVWLFPPEVFSAFTDVIILTYMFEAQIQKYYFDLIGFDINYIGTEFVNENYRFTGKPYHPAYLRDLVNKVHIFDDDKLNLIGDYEYSLSSSWYKREKDKSDKPLLKKLKNNTVNVYTNRFKSPAKSNMWTTFKEAKSSLGGKGYSSGFVSCNARATNEYAEKKHLAYLLNVYFNPFLKQYFSTRGIDVKEDEYALSELIQWIWRSAIRNGEEIWIYIPSKRMRDLLTNWLNKLSSQNRGENDS